MSSNDTKIVRMRVLRYRDKYGACEVVYWDIHC